MAIRCLLVDDSNEFLRSATRLLESSGFDIVGQANTSADALQLASQLEPELALVDIELGEEDGIALADQLGLEAPALKVILISAHERDDLREAIAGSRAIGFVPKSRLGAEAISDLL